MKNGIVRLRPKKNVIARQMELFEQMKGRGE